ncbi:MAG: hypothetical protein CM1200mP10_25840 [Candidatus Neomarinimicrobiota bacterium]|nr:MAG: hypothetical protein CM1200mP10_25840 [Candidatus Neomarinimicrobiota bacterium]
MRDRLGQDAYENYVARSIKKLALLNRKPVRVDPGMYRTWFEAAR